MRWGEVGARRGLRPPSVCCCCKAISPATACWYFRRFEVQEDAHGRDPMYTAYVRILYRIGNMQIASHRFARMQCRSTYVH